MLSFSSDVAVNRYVLLVVDDSANDLGSTTT